MQNVKECLGKDILYTRPKIDEYETIRCNKVEIISPSGEWVYLAMTELHHNSGAWINIAHINIVDVLN
jgi:hypothetical protein